jgi:large subunit ribosomal protein L25
VKVDRELKSSCAKLRWNVCQATFRRLKWTSQQIHGAIRVSELKISQKVKVLDEADQIVVHVVSVKEEVAPVAAATPVEGEAAAPAAPAEPEVMKKGKKEEEPAE